MKIIILCIALFSIIAFSGCLEENNVMNKDDLSEEDFEINAEWNNDYIPHFHTSSNENPLIASDSIHDEFIMNVISYHEKSIYYKIYDKSDNSELNLFYDIGSELIYTNAHITFTNYEDENKFTISLNSFEEQKEIEVYFSLDENFDIRDEGVVKLNTFLPQRKVDFEVNPSIINFAISKSIFPPSDNRKITIKNTGDIVLRIGVYPPYDAFYLPYKPQYVSGEQFGEILKPDESKSYEIISVIDATETPVGTYQTDLVIGTLFDDNLAQWNSVSSDTHFQKIFTLETTVTE